MDQGAKQGTGAASRALAGIAEPCTGLYRRRGSDLESPSGAMIRPEAEIGRQIAECLLSSKAVIQTPLISQI